MRTLFKFQLSRQKNGFAAVFLAICIPVLLYGAKYAVKKSIFSSWNIFLKHDNNVFKRTSEILALYVSSYWSPYFSLNQQRAHLEKIATHICSTHPEFHKGIAGYAIPGLERIDAFEIRPLRVTERTSLNGRYSGAGYRNEDLIYQQRIAAIHSSANPHFALYRLIDSASAEMDRPPIVLWEGKRNKHIPQITINDTDAFVSSLSFSCAEESARPFTDEINTLPDVSASMATTNLPNYPANTSIDIANADDHVFSDGSATASFFTRSQGFDAEFPLTNSRLSSMGITITNGDTVTDTFRIPEKSDNQEQPDIDIDVVNDRIKVTTNSVEMDENGTWRKIRHSAFSRPARCNVDIVLSIPTNAAACHPENVDSANGYTASLTDINAAANLTPIHQIAQAYRVFLRNHFFYAQGVNVGLIPYSGKISLPPTRSEWSTTPNGFFSEAFIQDMSDFPRKNVPSIRSSALYGTRGRRDAPLVSGNGGSETKISEIDLGNLWGTNLTAHPIMFRMGFQSREYGEYSDRITHGGNYIYTGSILSNENPATGYTPIPTNASTSNPEQPASANPYRFLRMNPNPCYLGCANLLNMQCEEDCVTYLPNPYYVIEMTANVRRIYEILGAVHPFHDPRNVSSFTFLPITWANNLLQSWTDGPSAIAPENTQGMLSRTLKTAPGRKKALIVMVNKPDFFEAGELTHLGFNNDHSEISMSESDKIDFASIEIDRAMQGYKGILTYTGTRQSVSGAESQNGVGTFSFPEIALLKIIVEGAGTFAHDHMPPGETTRTSKTHAISGRRIIYIESDSIDRSRNDNGKHTVNVSWQGNEGHSLKIVSAEITNAVQPARLEWSPGDTVIRSFNGRVPFTMKVRAPEASITFSPASDSAATEHAGRYLLTYRSDNNSARTFVFPSKHGDTDLERNTVKQIFRKLTYTLKNAAASYSVTNRHIRWFGGSRGWCDDGLRMARRNAIRHLNNHRLNVGISIDWKEIKILALTIKVPFIKFTRGHLRWNYPEVATGARVYATNAGGRMHFQTNNQDSDGSRLERISGSAMFPARQNVSSGSLESLNLAHQASIFSNFFVLLSSGSTLWKLACISELVKSMIATLPNIASTDPSNENKRIGFYGAGTIEVTAAASPNIPYFAIHNQNNVETTMSFDRATWTPNPNMEENDYVRTIYVHPATHSFQRNRYRANLFETTVRLEHGTQIISVDPDYGDTEAISADPDNPSQPAPRNPEDTTNLQWNGNGVIRTIGGKIPLQISVSPTKESVVEFSRVNDTSEERCSIAEGSELLGTHRIPYKDPDNTQTQTIEYKFRFDRPSADNNDYNSSSGASLSKLAYRLKNASMTGSVEDREIEWHGGENEWSDEGVSVLDSSGISIRDGDDSSHTMSTDRVSTLDGDATSIYTAPERRQHPRGRMVWTFPDKLNGTAVIQWSKNKPFFPTHDEELARRKYVFLKNSIEKNENSNTDTKEYLINGNATLEEIYNVYVDLRRAEIKIRSNLDDGFDENFDVVNVPEDIPGKTAYNDALARRVELENRINESANRINAITEEIANLERVKGGFADQKNSAENTKNRLMEKIESARAEKAELDAESEHFDSETEIHEDIIRTLEMNVIRFERDIMLLENRIMSFVVETERLAAERQEIWVEIRKFFADGYDEAGGWSTVSTLVTDIFDRIKALSFAAADKEAFQSAEDDYVSSMLGYYDINDIGIDDDAGISYQPGISLDSATRKYYNYRRDYSGFPIAAGLVEFIRAQRNDNVFFSSHLSNRDVAEIAGSSTVNGSNIEIFRILQDDDQNRHNTYGMFKNVNSEGDGRLHFLTLSTDWRTTSRGAVTNNDQQNFRKIFPETEGADENEFDESEQNEYWNAYEDMFGTPVSDSYTTSPGTINTLDVSMADRDVLMIFQPTRYFNGQRFYSMIFRESDPFALNFDTCDTAEENSETPTEKETSGIIDFCGTGRMQLHVAGSARPYIRLERATGGYDTFDFLNYSEPMPDGDDPAEKKVAEKIIYIDPEKYEFREIQSRGGRRVYEVQLSLSNVKINSVEVMSDGMSYAQTSLGGRFFDGASGRSSSDDLLQTGGNFPRVDDASHVNTNASDNRQIETRAYPGDGNLVIKNDAIGSEAIGRQRFWAGNTETLAPGELVPGLLRKFFPLWREHERHFIATSSTSTEYAAKLITTEFSHPINSVLFFGQDATSSLALSNDWQTAAGAASRGSSIHNQQEALGIVARDACRKLIRDYGEENVRIYLVKYRGQVDYRSMPDGGLVPHDYQWIEECATMIDGASNIRKIYNPNTEGELKEVMEAIALDIKEFAEYRAAE